MYVYIQIKWSQWNIKTFAYIHTNYLQYPLFYYLKKHNATMSDSYVKNWKKEKEKKKHVLDYNSKKTVKFKRKK